MLRGRAHDSVIEAQHPMPAGFGLLIAAQFVSALADNALLIVAIALLQQQDWPAWWAPLLKVGFMVSYVVLAPFVGPLADAVPKGRVMSAMNLVKIVGVLLLAAGTHPVLALTVVGFGAAAYAPAKYGLVTELVGPHRLVAANGWLEVTVVCAALMGAVVGGFLVSPTALSGEWSGVAMRAFAGLGWDEVGPLAVSLTVLLAVYGAASLLNLGVPASHARYPSHGVHPGALLRNFRQSNRILWHDADGGLSLAATTLFWGVGATLQFAVLRWAIDVLDLGLDQAAYLQAAVAVGVILGAGAAGRWVPLRRARDLLFAGVVLGLLMPVVASTQDVALAAGWLVLVGAVGGFMVVPLNALLQHRGFVLLTAGRSIAVQGFNENLSVLLMLGGYAGLQALQVPIVDTLWGLGLAIAASITVLIVVSRRRGRVQVA
jgi:LPLT family lysophospholipid transporter-like MFS transporter